LVRKPLDRALAGASAAAVAGFARNLRKSPEHCATGRMCYYPEVVLESQQEETPAPA
jgi:hypothetical protein